MADTASGQILEVRETERQPHSNEGNTLLDSPGAESAALSPLGLPESCWQETLDHIAAGFLPWEGVTAIAVLYAFLDESGIHDADYCAVGGFIGTPEQWKKFDGAWRTVLRRHDQKEFHAKNVFRRGHAKPHLRRFVNDLLGVVAKHKKLLPFLSIVSVADFKALSYGERRHFTGALHSKTKWMSSGAPSKPYFVAFCESIKIAIYEARERDRISFWFGRQDQYESLALASYGYAQEVLPEFLSKFGSISFATHSNSALQFADFLVYACTYASQFRDSKFLGLTGECRTFVELIHDGRKNRVHWFGANEFQLHLQKLSPETRSLLKGN